MEGALSQKEFDGIRVVLFGPESTGKSTLSRQLASYYKTVYVPEFAREFLQAKFDRTGEVCGFEDLMPICIGQRKLENEKVSQASGYLFCDTDALETYTYSHIYFGKAPEGVTRMVEKSHYELYLLMDVDLPWEKDDLRDRPDDREAIYKMFKKALDTFGKKYITISGVGDDRLKNAIEAINNYVENDTNRYTEATTQG